MHIKSVRFTEFPGQSREWNLSATSLGEINLIVGKNASGKTRFLNVIAGFAKLLRGEIPRPFESGSYAISLASGNKSYSYELTIDNHSVTREILREDDRLLLERESGSDGRIWSDKINKMLDFSIPNDYVAARAKRDKIQHPFLEDIHDWARDLRHIEFGTPLGRDRLHQWQDLISESAKAAEITDSSNVSKFYSQGFQKYGEDYDQAILRDLSALGYECSDVGISPVDQSILPIGQAAWLFVQEKDLQAQTPQVFMSQGMFRALSLVIQLNWTIFEATPRTLLIDDMGEGLDFSRAQDFVSLLIDRAVKHRIQIVMTSNDRFIMNGVPLNYWGVLTRRGKDVRVINVENSPTKFSEFEEIGLSNFDFFSSNFFEEEKK